MSYWTSIADVYTLYMPQSDAYHLPAKLSELPLNFQGGWNRAQIIDLNVWGTCVAFALIIANLPKTNLLEKFSGTTMG